MRFIGTTLLVLTIAAVSGLASCSSQSSGGGASVGAAGSGGMIAAGPVCVMPATGLPSDLFCTGLYVGGDATKLAADVMPYKPGVVLWSDGAEKHRYLYLPPSATIDTSNMDAWVFPVGTKVWKEFVVDGVLVETRLLWKRDASTWSIGTYVWDQAKGSATLNLAPKGTILPSGYEIPTTKDCDKCHHGGSDKVLGIEAVAMGLPLAEGATLAVLAQKGALSAPPTTTSITLPEDATGKAGPALGYLHANCGMPCHSTRGLGHETELLLRLRAGEFWPDGTTPGAPVAATATDMVKAMIGQPPLTASVAQQFPGANRVTPGAHDKSVVWLVSHLRGNYQMPPLVSHQVDEVGMKTLADWIDALPPN